MKTAHGATLPLPSSVGALAGLGRCVNRIVAAALLLALGLFFSRAPLSLVVALLAAAIGGLTLFIRPHLGLYLLALAMPFGSLRTVNLGGVQAGAVELLLAATLGAWALKRLASGRFVLPGTRLAWLAALFIGCLLLSLLAAQDLGAALSELAKWIEVGLLLVMTADLLTLRQRPWLLGALLLGGLAEAALGIYQFLAQVGPEGFVLMGRFMRAYGTFRQPNPFGGYMGLLLPSAYGLVLALAPKLATSRGRERTAVLLGIALGLLASLLLGAALIMSWSRGALLGAAVAALAVLAGLGKRAGVVLALILVVAVLVAPWLVDRLPSDVMARFTDVFAMSGQDLSAIEITDENFSVIERAAHWQAAWRLFEKSPWLGVGIGQYPVRYAEVAVPRWQDALGHAHNYYLHLLTETGLLGLAGYLVFLTAAFAVAWRSARRTSGWGQAVALGALGLLGHLAGHNLVDNLYVQNMYLLLALYLGMVAIPLAKRGGTSLHETT